MATAGDSSAKGYVRSGRLPADYDRLAWMTGSWQPTHGSSILLLELTIQKVTTRRDEKAGLAADALEWCRVG